MTRLGLALRTSSQLLGLSHQVASVVAIGRSGVQSVFFLACLSFALAIESRAEASPPLEGDAIRSIVAAFDRYPLVGIGENHGLKQAGDFYVTPGQDAEFPTKVGA